MCLADGRGTRLGLAQAGRKAMSGWEIFIELTTRVFIPALLVALPPSVICWFVLQREDRYRRIKRGIENDVDLTP